MRLDFLTVLERTKVAIREELDSRIEPVRVQSLEFASKAQEDLNAAVYELSRNVELLDESIAGMERVVSSGAYDVPLLLEGYLARADLSGLRPSGPWFVYVRPRRRPVASVSAP